MLSKLFSKYVLIAITSLVLGACTKVPAGNVGVKFDLYGGDKGVTGEVVGPGEKIGLQISQIGIKWYAFVMNSLME